MTALLTRLKTLGKIRLSRRILLLLCTAWCTAMLLPLFLISFSAHPVHDDFPHTLAATEAWMRTGSLWETGKAAIDYTIHMYNTWQGTFTAMFLSAFQPMVFSPRLFPLTPILTLVGLCLSAGYFSKTFIRRVLKADASACAVFFSVLMTMLIQFLPSAREVIYWYSGTPYSLSMILLFIMLGLLLKLHGKTCSHSSVFHCALLFFCGVLLGGCPYPLALGGVLGFLFIALWAFGTRSPGRWACLCALVGISLALALVVAAPGNAVRQTRVGQPMDPLMTIVLSVSECAKTTGKWFSPQLLAIILLLLPLLLPALRSSNFRFRRPFLFLTASFGILSASFVPPIYATGVEGYRVERVLSSLYMLYVLLMLVNIVYLAGFMVRRFDSHRAWPEFLERKGLTLGMLALSVTLLVWGLLSNAIMATPSVSSAKSLLTGEAAQYNREMTDRETQMAASSSRAHAVSAIHPLMAEPVVLPRDMLPYQKEGSIPAMMRRYYRMQQLGELFGPGNIPESQWEGLDAWPEN